MDSSQVTSLTYGKTELESVKWRETMQLWSPQDTQELKALLRTLSSWHLVTDGSTYS
jgi:hypothetical protein